MVRINVSVLVLKNSIPNYFRSNSLTLPLHPEHRLASCHSYLLGSFEPTEQIQTILFPEGQKGLGVRLSH